LCCQVILFSHPDDFTPVCTTELAEVSRREADFAKRNVKVIGLSTNSVESHHKWIKDINEWGKTDVQYPIVCIFLPVNDLPSHSPQIADSDRKIATLYDMLDYQDASNVDKKGLPLTVIFFQYSRIYSRVESGS
jgi:glutaredoxin/glutathione-dependent peroxiredoxin